MRVTREQGANLRTWKENTQTSRLKNTRKDRSGNENGKNIKNVERTILRPAHEDKSIVTQRAHIKAGREGEARDTYWHVSCFCLVFYIAFV